VFTRVLLGSTNFVLALILVIIMYRYAASVSHRLPQFRKANILTIFAAITELICVFMPNLYLFVVVWAHFKEPEDIMTYAVFLVELDGFLNALICRFVLKRRPGKLTPIKTVQAHSHGSRLSNLPTNKPTLSACF
jgi:hypothetical protein